MDILNILTTAEKICYLLRKTRKFNEKYNKIWEVIRQLLKVDFTVGPV